MEKVGKKWFLYVCGSQAHLMTEDGGYKGVWGFFFLSFIDFLEMQNIITSPSVYVIKWFDVIEYLKNIQVHCWNLKIPSSSTHQEHWDKTC